MVWNKAIHGGVIFNHSVTTNYCSCANQTMLPDSRIVADAGAALDMRFPTDGHPDPDGVWAI